MTLVRKKSRSLPKWLEMDGFAQRLGPRKVRYKAPGVVLGLLDLLEAER